MSTAEIISISAAIVLSATNILSFGLVYVMWRRMDAAERRAYLIEMGLT